MWKVLWCQSQGNSATPYVFLASFSTMFWFLQHVYCSRIKYLYTTRTTLFLLLFTCLTCIIHFWGWVFAWDLFAAASAQWSARVRVKQRKFHHHMVYCTKALCGCLCTSNFLVPTLHCTPRSHRIRLHMCLMHPLKKEKSINTSATHPWCPQLSVYMSIQEYIWGP